MLYWICDYAHSERFGDASKINIINAFCVGQESQPLQPNIYVYSIIYIYKYISYIYL